MAYGTLVKLDVNKALYVGGRIINSEDTGVTSKMRNRNEGEGGQGRQLNLDQCKEKGMSEAFSCSASFWILDLVNEKNSMDFFPLNT